jgi:hypothetical protein
LHVDLALYQAELENLEHLLQLEIRIGCQVDSQLCQFKASFSALVVTTLQRLVGIVDGSGNFMFVPLGHHVE